MRADILQLDTSDTTPKGIERVNVAMSEQLEKLEKNGFNVLSEDFLPQMNAIRSLLLVMSEKKSVSPTKYVYRVFDSRNGFGIVNKLLAEEILKIEKEGNKIVRTKLVPMRNDAFVQLLLVAKKPEPEVGVRTEKTITGEEKNEGSS